MSVTLCCWSSGAAVRVADILLGAQPSYDGRATHAAENLVALPDAAFVLVTGCKPPLAIHRFAPPAVLATFARPVRARRKVTLAENPAAMQETAFVLVAGCKPPLAIHRFALSAVLTTFAPLWHCDIS
jgi:hypothetical protein